MGVLGGVPHGQPIVLGLVVGHEPTRLERRWSQALDAVALPHDMGGLRKGRFDVTTSIARAQGDIRAQLLVHEGSVCLHRLQRVDDGGQGCIAHLD